MEQIIINVDSKSTSSAIKNFVHQFSDATIEEVKPVIDSYYIDTYGVSKQEFENRLNKGIAEAVLGNTKDWATVKEELLAKINRQ